MNWVIDYTIIAPAVVGTLFLLIPGKLKAIKGIISLAVALFVSYYAFKIFKLPAGQITPHADSFTAPFLAMNIDALSKMVVLFIGFFGVIAVLYSLKFVRNTESFRGYYGKILLTLAASFGAESRSLATIA